MTYGIESGTVTLAAGPRGYVAVTARRAGSDWRFVWRHPETFAVGTRARIVATTAELLILLAGDALLAFEPAAIGQRQGPWTALGIDRPGAYDDYPTGVERRRYLRPYFFETPTPEALRHQPELTPYPAAEPPPAGLVFTPYGPDDPDLGGELTPTHLEIIALLNAARPPRT